MRRSKKILSIVLFIGLSFFVVGCSKSETGTKDADNALSAAKAIFNEYPDKIGFHKVLKHWNFELPSGEKFEWTKDVGENKADYAMVTFAEPFLKAGLDPKKLDEVNWLFKPAEVEAGVQLPDRLIHPYNISDKAENSNGWEDALRRDFKKEPKIIKYHMEQKHYRLMLGEGFEVQWTEKLGINDADMVFLLKAEPLIKAGVDVEKMKGSGWILKPAGTDPEMGDNPDQFMRVYKIKT